MATTTQRRAGRPHRIPPPPPAPGTGSTAGSLDDVASRGGDLWVVLWQALADVWLWASVAREQRGYLFGPSRAGARERGVRARRDAPELTEALGTFQMLRMAGDVLDPQQVGDACKRVYAWAEAGSLIELAAHFAEASAVADPDDPARANEAARLCRRAALDRRAATWYERAFHLAVRAQNRRETIWALLGYGSLLYGLGQSARARPYFEKVARRAARTRRRSIAAEAHHDLILLCLDLNDFAQAEEHAGLAEDLYPRQHRRIPYLVHDCAVLLVREGFHTAALSLLRRLPLHFPRPEEATLVWSTLARAAGGAGQVAGHRDAERRTLELAGLYEEHGAAAMVNLAEAARSLADDARADRYVTLALEIAARRRDGGQARLARELRRRIRKDEPVPAEAPAPDKVAALSRRLAARLRVWQGSAPPEPSAGGGPPAGGGASVA